MSERTSAHSAAQTVTQSSLVCERAWVFVRRLSFLPFLLYFSSSLTFGTFVVSNAASVLDEFVHRAVHFLV